MPYNLTILRKVDEWEMNCFDHPMKEKSTGSVITDEEENVTGRISNHDGRNLILDSKN